MKLDLYEDTRAEFLLTGKARKTTADSYCAVRKTWCHFEAKQDNKLFGVESFDSQMKESVFLAV